MKSRIHFHQSTEGTNGCRSVTTTTIHITAGTNTASISFVWNIKGGRSADGRMVLVLLLDRGHIPCGLAGLVNSVRFERSFVGTGMSRHDARSTASIEDRNAESSIIDAEC